MSVLVIAGLLAGAAVPSLRALYLRAQADTCAVQLTRQLQLARALAVTEGRRVSICGLGADGRCRSRDITRVAVFVDSNRNARLDPEEPLRSDLRLRYSGAVSLRASNATRIVFNSDGSARQWGSWWLCPAGTQAASEGSLSRRVTVQRAGRIYRERDQDARGWLERTGECDTPASE